jgi:hypothetical protein
MQVEMDRAYLKLTLV